MREKLLLEELFYNYRRTWDRKVSRFISGLFSKGSVTNGEFLLRGGSWSKNIKELITAVELNQTDREILSEIVEKELGGVGDRRIRERGKVEVAYFCAEFGIDDSIPNYAGGLGILAGDHLKTASDLGLSLVGIGIWYPGGYFEQRTTPRGKQIALERELSPDEVPLRPVLLDSGEPYEGKVELGGEEIFFRVWYAKVGESLLYLLDPSLQKNREEWKRPFYRLYYSQGIERLKMELLLGFGGIRLLKDLGISAAKFHLNEGHTAFVSLARLIDELESGKGWDFALSKVRENQLFTTHTPVEAGHDRFDFSDVSGFLRGVLPGEYLDRALALGSEQREGNELFCMTALGIRTSCRVNAVSELHREVTARMWDSVLGEDSVGRLCHITNGIHIETWIYPEFEELYREYLGEDWLELLFDSSGKGMVLSIPVGRIWEVKLRAKGELFQFFRERAMEGRAKGDTRIIDSRGEGEILVIGFARRFAAYKRADLIFEDLSEISGILNDIDRPVVIFFSGKAHPRDREGQKILERVIRFTGDDRFKGKVLWLDNYSMEVAKRLVWGVDLWLNNPILPMEASGTSGQKVLVNFGLNCSIPDGWWAEVGHGVGWKIGNGERFVDMEIQRRRDAESLYLLLRGQIVPKFFARGEEGYPNEWLLMARRSAAELSGRFSSRRMLREYIDIYRKLENI